MMKLDPPAFAFGFWDLSRENPGTHTQGWLVFLVILSACPFRVSVSGSFRVSVSGSVLVSALLRTVSGVPPSLSLLY